MKKNTFTPSLFNTLLLAFAVSLLTACPGCATFNSDPLPELVVRIIDPTHFEVDGKIVAPDALPKAMKQAGAGETTKISLQLPPGASPNAFTMVYAKVREEGYRQVIFTHPREAKAEVHEAARPAPPPPSSRKPLRK